MQRMELMRMRSEQTCYHSPQSLHFRIACYMQCYKAAWMLHVMLTAAITAMLLRCLWLLLLMALAFVAVAPSAILLYNQMERDASVRAEPFVHSMVGLQVIIVILPLLFASCDFLAAD